MTASVATDVPARIGQIAIPVRDIARAVGFYRDVLGLRFLFQVQDTMAFFDCGGVRLMLAVPEEEPFEPPASILYYAVGDLPAATARMRAGGAQVERDPHLLAKMPDHDLWMAFLRDSEGNVFALMSEVPRG